VGIWVGGSRGGLVVTCRLRVGVKCLCVAMCFVGCVNVRSGSLHLVPSITTLTLLVCGGDSVRSGSGAGAARGGRKW